ncbi:MFS transporter [Streptomyces sp. H10-C2]|uniref:MFS transporter n=1 Tax=unclassified Streptomyces TaxID=2593676 RepID=UPI0024B9120B|nr:MULTISPECIES: MFS transporter [unclassified Streptomyces]MDJ0343781.1 MFS transporter [Streptomyces sp. PH10-H1]MDJ0373302.1 MFS transporter [Streptomyces sp. H10-C2]
MATGYADLLRTRHAARLLSGTLIGRLPNATAALCIVLLTRAEGGSYSLAGSLGALYGLGTAVGQPLLGRITDRYGQPRVMLPSAVLSAAGMVLFALSGPDPLPVACVAMVVAGLFTPPLEGGLRALWPGVLKSEDRLHAAYALDAAAQELMFTIGPVLVTALVAVASETAAVLWIAAVGVAGALGVVTAPPSREWRAEPRAADWLGPLRAPELRALIGSLFFVGVALGSIAVAAVAYADVHGGGMVNGYLLSALGLGALIGGVTYGARPWPGTPERRLRVLAVGLAICYAPLVLVPGVVAMTVLSGLAGVFLAPVLACAFVVVDRHAPSGTVTEAFSWLVTAIGVGASLGTAAAGPAAQFGGVAAGFAVAVAGGVVALAVLLATARFLAPPNLKTELEKDRIDGVELGFSATHQA